MDIAPLHSWGGISTCRGIEADRFRLGALFGLYSPLPEYLRRTLTWDKGLREYKAGHWWCEKRIVMHGTQCRL